MPAKEVTRTNPMGRYRMIRSLGEGASGSAYVVSDVVSGKKCVLKKIPLDEEAEEQGLRSIKTSREVQVLSALDHPNVVRYETSFVVREEDALWSNRGTISGKGGKAVGTSHRGLSNRSSHEDDDDDGGGGGGEASSSVSSSYCNIIMELCDNGTVEDLIWKQMQRNGGKAFDNDILIEWFAELLSALHYIHSRGVVHRDIKASNIFVTNQYHLKVGDFGISRKEQVLDKSGGDISITASATKDSNANLLMGTPCYMAPELLEEHCVYDERSDIWSLGVVFYELCTLRKPFDGNTFLSIVNDILTSDVAPFNMPGVDPRVEDLVMSMLVKDKSKRPTALELIETHLDLPSTHPSHPEQDPSFSRRIQETYGYNVVFSPLPSRAPGSLSRNSNNSHKKKRGHTAGAKSKESVRGGESCGREEEEEEQEHIDREEDVWLPAATTMMATPRYPVTATIMSTLKVSSGSTQSGGQKEDEERQVVSECTPGKFQMKKNWCDDGDSPIPNKPTVRATSTHSTSSTSSSDAETGTPPRQKLITPQKNKEKKIIGAEKVIVPAPSSSSSPGSSSQRSSAAAAVFSGKKVLVPPVPLSKLHGATSSSPNHQLERKKSNMVASKVSSVATDGGSAAKNKITSASSSSPSSGAVSKPKSVSHGRDRTSSESNNQFLCHGGGNASSSSSSPLGAVHKRKQTHAEKHGEASTTILTQHSEMMKRIKETKSKLDLTLIRKQQQIAARQRKLHGRHQGDGVGDNAGISVVIMDPSTRLGGVGERSDDSHHRPTTTTSGQRTEGWGGGRVGGIVQRVDGLSSPQQRDEQYEIHDRDRVDPPAVVEYFRDDEEVHIRPKHWDPYHSSSKATTPPIHAEGVANLTSADDDPSPPLPQMMVASVDDEEWVRNSAITRRTESRAEPMSVKDGRPKTLQVGETEEEDDDDDDVIMDQDGCSSHLDPRRKYTEGEKNDETRERVAGQNVIRTITDGSPVAVMTTTDTEHVESTTQADSQINHVLRFVTSADFTLDDFDKLFEGLNRIKAEQCGCY